MIAARAHTVARLPAHAFPCVAPPTVRDDDAMFSGEMRTAACGAQLAMAMAFCLHPLRTLLLHTVAALCAGITAAAAEQNMLMLRERESRSKRIRVLRVDEHPTHVEGVGDGGCGLAMCGWFVGGCMLRTTLC